MVAFVRFINVMNQNSLLESLCRIRIGNIRMHANMASFSREAVNLCMLLSISSSNKINNNKKFVGRNSYAKVLSGDNHVDMKASGSDNLLPKTSIKCDRDQRPNFPMAILGCYNDFRSIENTCSLI